MTAQRPALADVLAVLTTVVTYVVAIVLIAAGDLSTWILVVLAAPILLFLARGQLYGSQQVNGIKMTPSQFPEGYQLVAEAAADNRPIKFLVQGTLYPDVVESGGGATAGIKSHHNVGGLPDDLEFELIEPLRTLFKDEVRAIGAELGLPHEIVQRQPFPGPGLGIRIVGEINKERLDLLRKADAIVRAELTAAGLDAEIWQCPVVLLADVRSVGVQGDGRTYGHPIVLRPVSSEDAMTADWTRLPYDVLAKISNRITNEVAGVNRVVLDVTSKPPGTIEWE